MEDRFRVGIITDTHGIRGEVKVFPTTEDPDRFNEIPEVILQEADGGEKVLGIERARRTKDRVILKFKGIDNINDIEAYKKCELYVTRENAVPLSEGEYYVADLLGLRVEDESGEFLGELTDVISTGANDVYEISAPGRDKKILIPAIKDCILDTDIKEGIMKVHILPGLLDL
ncbi:MAG: 16S rRNA processing protein RimM [Lachnospiraceae bacterium]|nr:16S rRNA processing protein RimM [Lachnospiraceae bacterium]